MSSGAPLQRLSSTGTASGSNPTSGIAKRRGPQPKAIKDRTLDPEIRPIIRPERSWSQQQKIRVLVFLYHHRIPGRSPSSLRPPTQQEASIIFGVPQRTISGWVQRENDIEKFGFHSAVSSARVAVVCKWPELETRLYRLFLERRERGRSVRRGWFRLHANAIYRELFPSLATDTSGTSVFRFSNGWFEGFLGRFRISLRCITKKAQNVPEDYRKLVIDWLRFNRRNSQPELPTSSSNWMEIVLNRSANRYLLSNICNLDETPLPFEYLSGRTYDRIGSKTVWVKESRNGWDKRQASLVLCVFADGVNRVPPMIIFHGKGNVLTRESPEYHPGVIVEFNDKAYMNDTLFLKYIELYLMPALGGRPTLFALDKCTSHYTPAVLNFFRQNSILPSLIPAGCTSLVQPLDISINKPLKERIRELTDEAIIEAEERVRPGKERVQPGEESDFEKWTVSQRRIMTTWTVGDAWYQFSVERTHIIINSFRSVGLSLPVDGSEDWALRIKGFEEIEVGDWRRQPEVLPDQLDVQFTDITEQNDYSEEIEFVAHGEE